MTLKNPLLLVQSNSKDIGEIALSFLREIGENPEVIYVQPETGEALVEYHSSEVTIDGIYMIQKYVEMRKDVGGRSL